MTTSTKAPNYSAQNVERMVSVYSSAATDADRKDAVQSLAKELGKGAKSIIAKLSREGVYKVAAKTTKTGKAIVRKANLVAHIAAALDLNPSELESLLKATKTDLETLHKAVI